jgi:hypothetical protein
MRWRRDAAPDVDLLEPRLVWMVGSPRTGSTWLLNLLKIQPDIRTLDEPLVGAHLGLAATGTVGASARSPVAGRVPRAVDVFAEHDDYFFGDRYRAAWQPALRRLVLERFGAQLTATGGDLRRHVLVVKEPHGSEAIDLLADALPTCRILAVVRDGRDVVDSLLDAVQPGAWASSLAQVGDTAAERLRFVEDTSALWAERTDVVLRTIERVGSRRALLLRYEDLLEATEDGVRRILEWLGLDVPKALGEHVERLAFGRVDEAHRGTGHFHRAATPGGWREHLTTDEQHAAGRIMGSQLTQLGYDAPTDAHNGQP